MEQGLLVTGGYELIDDCDITKNAQRGYSGPGWACALCLAHGGHNTIVQNTRSWENHGEGLSSWSGSGGESYGNVIQDCVAWDNWANNIYLSNTWDCLVQRNLVYNTFETSQGIEVGDEYSTMQNHDNTIINNVVIGCSENFKWWSGPSSSDGMRGFVIAHNTFINATDVNIEVQGGGGSHTGCQFVNNIVYQQSGDIANFEAGFNGIEFSHNIWSQSAGTGDIVTNPKINSDGSLQSDSPAIDAGLAGYATDDVTGAARDSLPDIGAYEYMGVVNPTNTPVNTVEPTLTSTIEPTATSESPTVTRTATATVGSETVVVIYTPRPTYTVNPTYTPMPTYTANPTYTPWPSRTPTSTPSPTFTVLPTATEYPTHTPYPTQTPYPTHTPYPTYTPYPTHTPFM